jgi:hypothetical protein
MALRVGDRVEEQARSTVRSGRAGVIRTVVHGDPTPRYRIRWDDGHETVYTPAAGSLRREPAAARPAKKRSAPKVASKRATGKAATGKAAGKTQANSRGRKSSASRAR